MRGQNCSRTLNLTPSSQEGASKGEVHLRFTKVKRHEILFYKVGAADAAGDWQGVLRWEECMREMMEGRSDLMCQNILSKFTFAHRSGIFATGIESRSVGVKHARSVVRLQERRIILLAKMKRFRDQGGAMCMLAETFVYLKNQSESGKWFQRARAVAECHGFYSVESKACLGLGECMRMAGCIEEGLDLLRNGLTAASLSEDEDINSEELMALPFLIDALFAIDGSPSSIADALDELEPLVPRFRKAAKEESRSRGRVDVEEFRGPYYSARLHEVLKICTLCVGNPITLLYSCIPPRPLASVIGSTTPA